MMDAALLGTSLALLPAFVFRGEPLPGPAALGAMAGGVVLVAA